MNPGKDPEQKDYERHRQALLSRGPEDPAVRAFLWLLDQFEGDALDTLRSYQAHAAGSALGNSYASGGAAYIAQLRDQVGFMMTQQATAADEEELKAKAADRLVGRPRGGAV